MTHCIHYGACGGCVVADHARLDNAAPLRLALVRAGFADAPVGQVVAVPLGSRRRADLAAARLRDGSIVLGLHRARGTEIVDMAACALLAPPLMALLVPLRLLLRGLSAFRRTGSVVINLVDNGPDVLLRADGPFTVADRAKLVSFARAQGLPRISIADAASEPEAVAVLEPPVISFAGVAVEPAPGAFLQASAAGEAAIIAAIMAGLPTLTAKSRIVELHAGIGTLTFALARLARVEAYEGFAPAVAALDRAVRRQNLAGRVAARRRDLVRQPLTRAELAGRATVVLDPPFAGAAAQMANLAAAKVPRIIYVSCNPKTLGTDAAILARAGYAVRQATPIDQFLFSDNLESVVTFSRA